MKSNKLNELPIESIFKKPNYLNILVRWLKYRYQKLTRGFSDDIVWSLDWTFAKFILPRLKFFREINSTHPLGGHPGDLSMEEWNSRLDDMIYALEVNADGHWGAPGDTDWTRHSRGLQYFGKHFNDLWL